MDKELINRAWSVLPKEFKEEVKKVARIYSGRTSALFGGERHIANKFLDEFIGLFGFHNLTSDAEGEEMLTVPRRDIIELYQEVQKTISQCKGTELAIQAIGIKNVLWSFFGSKCLPGEGGKLPANCQQVKNEPQAPGHFRDSTKKADLSPKEADLLISRTLRDFDFIKVHKCMESLGWNWIIGEDRHIPSVGELYQEAEELLKSAVEKQCNIFSGGLQAYFDGDEVALLFAVDTSGCTLEELESEKKSITK
ncbi:MAG: hypothetical protein J6K19_03830 [Prevotella sp.]|nr:hypothetical protein [Prevotella sp.]